MSEGQTLFLVLCLLYLSDCLVWIGKRMVLFASPWCRRWRTSFGSKYAGNSAGCLAILNPLPPLGTAFLAHWTPISLSRLGICDLGLQVVGETGRPAQTGRVFTFEDIVAVAADGRYVSVNGSRFAKCGTPEQAEMLSQLIRRLSREPVENREKVIRESIDAQLDKQEASRRLTQVRDLIRSLRWMCSAFFVFLYIVIPILVSIYGLTRFVIPVAGIMFLAAVDISLRFNSVHRAIYPLRRGDRVGDVVKMVLCPPAAMRAIDLLTLDAMSQFHPVVISDLLLSPEDTDFVRAVVCGLKYPLHYDLTDPKGIAVVLWYASAQLDACAKLIRARDSRALDRLLAPPLWDGTSTAYCPRCLCQYTIQSGECPDCPGVKTLPLQHT
jgi:hypothetical protein